MKFCWGREGREEKGREVDGPERKKLFFGSLRYALLFKRRKERFENAKAVSELKRGGEGRRK
mgnify:CR=1 FL=1